MSGLAYIKILVVDDDPQARNFLAQYLEEENCNVKTASDGKEALAMFVDFKPAVVLLDINMPKINGLKVLKMIKEKYPEVHVIMTTGVATLAATRECLASGAFTHVVKPIDFDQLRSVIARALGIQEDWSTAAPTTYDEDQDILIQAIIETLGVKNLVSRKEIMEQYTKLKNKK